MDIAFFIPRSPEMDKTFFDSVHNGSIEMVPLGVFYMATLLKDQGYEVSVVDFNAISSEEDRKRKLQQIINKKPKIVGISTSTLTYPGGIKLAETLRKEMESNCVLVWGGYHVTFLPEEPLRLGLADIIVRGEGEYALLQIAKVYLEHKGDLREIEGISFRQGEDIIHNSPEILRIKELSALPYPDRTFADLSGYRNPGTIICSRGCVAKCQFCAAGSFGGVVSRDTEDVVAEIKSLHFTYGYKHLFFIDNTFTTYKKRTIEILERVKEEGLEIKFSIESRASQVNTEYIKKIVDVGVIAIQFGVETGNDSVMKEIKKGITLEQVERAVDLCLTHGIRVMTSFVIGHPGDTKETVRDTISFAKKLRRKGAMVTFGILTPFPGTEVYNCRRKLGVEIVDWDFGHWDLATPVIRTKHLSAKDLRSLHNMAVSEVNSIY